MGKTRLKNNTEENVSYVNYVIDSTTTLQELQKIKSEIQTAIRSKKGVKPKDKNMLKQLPFLANQILEMYDDYPDKDILNDILDDIANYMIEINKGNRLANLHDIRLGSTFRKETLYSIHSRTLFEGNKQIPENFSIEYFADLVNTRNGSPQTEVDKLIYDEEVLKFIEGLGKDFRIKNPKQYLDIVSAVVYNPIKNNSSVAQDPRVNQSERILNILVNYARTYKDYADEQGLNKDLEIGEIISIIQFDFANLIGKMRPYYWEKLQEKLQDCFDGLILQKLPRDITSYGSYADFINDVNKNIVDPVGPVPHTPVPRIIVNHGSHTGGMTCDEKFFAIQNLIRGLRKNNPDLVVPTVWVGYKKPFEGHVVFPLEKQHLSQLKEMEVIPENSIYNTVIMDVFENKESCFRVMTRKNVTAVLGDDRKNATAQQQGVAKRRDATKIPGVISLEHNKKLKGAKYYEEMIQEAVEEVAKNPQVQFGKNIRIKISEMSGNRTTNSGSNNASNNVQSNAVTSTPTNTTQATSVQPVQTTIPKRFVDNCGYDKYGISIIELSLTDPYTQKNGKLQEQKREEIRTDLKNKYGYGRNPGLDLLDYCLEEMLVSGKSIVSIVTELANKPEYKSVPRVAERMYAYVKNMVIVAVDNDPDYPNEKMKEIYEREIALLTEKSTDLDTEIAEKREKRAKIAENTKKAARYFGTDYEK